MAETSMKDIIDSVSKIRKKTIEGLEVGDTFVTSRKFTEQDVLSFSDISRDYNPVHYDERFASAKNYHSRICHGLLVASLVTEIGGQIGWLATSMSFKFLKPVYVGDTVKCIFKITKIEQNNKAEAEVICKNRDGVKVLECLITGMIPNEKERSIMKSMVEEGDLTNKLRGRI